MSQEFSVGNDVKEFISEIILKNNLDPSSKIEYEPGSEMGDGYTSDNISVKIQDKDKSLHLFLKCSGSLTALDGFKSLYAIEIFFFNVVQPAYGNFQKKHKVQDIFESVPKFYGVYSNGSREIIALENLKPKQYELFSRYDLYNDEHLTCILKEFGKFHAISYAFQEQEKETYDNWRDHLFDFNGLLKSAHFEQMFVGLINDFLSKLDPSDDKDILIAYGDIVEVMNSSFSRLRMEYATITKGDCWNNNMLFKYENSNKEKPIDIMLIDWQMMKESSPVLDLLLVVYPMATSEILDNMDHYLKIYHDELSFRIRQLGSDPEILYPYSAFVKEWDEIAAAAFSTTVTMLKIMITEREDMVDFETIMNADVRETFSSYRKDDEYMRRLKMIARHLINRKKTNFRKTRGTYESTSLKLM